MKRQPDLVQVITAGNASARLTRCLDCRQQQGYQDTDDRDHNEQLDQRKTAMPGESHQKDKRNTAAREIPLPRERRVLA
jgi:hypothetical protein